MRKIAFWGCLLLCLWVFLPVRAEISVSFSPEAPRKGEIVDVLVRPDREAQSVIYELRTAGGVVFSGKEDSHFSAAFRPREEADYTLTVTVIYGKKDQETASVQIPVRGEAPVQMGADIVYSQKDGWWKKSSYGSSTVEKAGCALFTLSHAMQRLGFSGEALLPSALGKTYAGCLVKGGTANERLLTQAGQVYDFITQDDLDESAADIAACLRRGDFFSFSIVIGHIALADGLSEDGTRVHIVDSAPSATFERIKNGQIYVQDASGAFVPVASPEELPGVRWFFETRHCSGSSYWLDLDYCARRGMRLIRPRWLTLNAEGESLGVSLDQVGTMLCRVSAEGDEEPRWVLTRDLTWRCIGAEAPQIAMVSKKSGTTLRDGEGKKMSGYKLIPAGTLLLPLQLNPATVYVAYKGTFGYINRADVTLLDLPAEGFRTGLITVGGRSSGTSTVKVRADHSAKARVIAEWKIGSHIAVVEQKNDFFLVEARGARGWVHEKYITLEGGENDGSEISQGE